MQLRQRAGCPQRRARDREQPSALTSTLTTEAFGNPVAQWGSSANPYRFAGAWGYRNDGDAGLLHVGARYYDPQVVWFLSRGVEQPPVVALYPTGQAQSSAPRSC
jgi:RHS repeat-associated protein